MSLKFLGLAALLAFLPTFAAAADTDPSNSAPLSASEIKAPDGVKSAEQTVRSQLKDPASARFEDVHLYTTGADTFACGHVNAMNGFGGYTGMQPFYVLIFERHLPNGKAIYVGAVATIANISTRYDAEVWEMHYPKCSID